MSAIQLFLKDATGKTHCIGPEYALKTDSTVASLKTAIKKLLGYDTSSQRLLFAGKQLNDAKADSLKLSDYGIRDDSTVFCLVRLIGGGSQQSKISTCFSVSSRIKHTSSVQNRQANIKTTADSSIASQSSSASLKTVKIRIVNSGNTRFQLSVDQGKTVRQVKQAIYQGGFKQLSPDEMNLSYNGLILSNQKKISYYNLNNSPVMQVEQLKACLKEIASIVASDVPDEATLESVTAVMPCGHRMGKGAMTALIRSLIDQKQYIIKCPYFKADQIPCNCKWDYGLCSKIGVLTADERQEFEVGLSQNWLKYNSVRCPKCYSWLIKSQDGSLKIICSFCPLGDRKELCVLCLHPWRANNNLKECGNEDCKAIRKRILLQCPTKTFQYSQIEVQVPLNRMCPWCTAVVEHKGGCKRMKCVCMKQFCFVCLKKKGENGWSCGNYDTYCGYLAPRQQIQQD